MAKTQRLAIGFLHEIFFGDVGPELSVDDGRCIKRLRYEPSATNIADLCTKPLPADRHRYLMDLIGMRSLADLFPN